MLWNTTLLMALHCTVCKICWKLLGSKRYTFWVYDVQDTRNHLKIMQVCFFLFLLQPIIMLIHLTTKRPLFTHRLLSKMWCVKLLTFMKYQTEKRTALFPAKRSYQVMQWLILACRKTRCIRKLMLPWSLPTGVQHRISMKSLKFQELSDLPLVIMRLTWSKWLSFARLCRIFFVITRHQNPMILLYIKELKFGTEIQSSSLQSRLVVISC